MGYQTGRLKPLLCHWLILKIILLFTRLENNSFFFSQSVLVLYKTEWLHQVPVGKQAMLSYLTSCRYYSIREIMHQSWAQYCGITTSSIFGFIFSMFKSVQLLAETAEPMTFMKSVTVILELGKLCFALFARQWTWQSVSLSVLYDQSDHQEYLSPLVMKIVSMNL